MASNTGEQLTQIGLSHVMRWVWATVGVAGLAFFLILAAMVGLTSRQKLRTSHGTAVFSSSMIMSQSVTPWRQAINRAAQATGVPAPWIAAEIQVESHGVPNAGTWGGAYGLMQLEPGTMGLTNAERANPETNIMAGARYLASLYGVFHSWREASAAYYGGSGLMIALLPSVPMSWHRAETWLQVVPNPGANTLTLAQYGSEVAAVARQWGKRGPVPMG